MHHLREDDGSYWTGLVFADGKRWPEERTTWTGAAMILAADALSSTTPANGVFRGDGLPRGLESEFDCACATSDRQASDNSPATPDTRSSTRIDPVAATSRKSPVANARR